VVGVLRAPSAELALTALRAAVRGGLRALEVTFTTPGAEAVLRELARTLPEGVLLGAGTVLDAAQAEAAVESGAAFLVSPHLGEDVLEVARRHGVPYLPGVLTPTEVVRALHLGAEVLKVFPIGSTDLPAAPVRCVVDSTGAGDAWNGALLHALGQGAAPTEAVRLAHRVAALKLEHRGAVPPQAVFNPRELRSLSPNPPGGTSWPTS